jgi:outer membrane protein OmpU
VAKASYLNPEGIKMKNILLASTALVLTAGVASAEITFSGTAGAGIFKQGKIAAVAPDTSAAAASALTAAFADWTAAFAANSAATAALAGAASTTYNTLAASAADAAADLAAAAAALGAAQTKVDGKAAVAAASHYSVYSGIDINITASTTTDNGMTISAATDMGAGSLLDAGDRELDANTDDLTAPEIKISYAGVTVELESEGVQDYYDGDLDNYDIGISGSFGDVAYGIALETDRKGGGSDYSATLGYSSNGMAFTLNTNEVDGADDLTSLSASYTMGALKATLKADNKGADKDVSTLTLAYTAGPATLTLSAANDKDNAKNTNKGKRGSWDATVKYVAGAYTINATTNESDAWNANVNYDLGGGASMVVGADSTETSFAGVSFAF